MSAVSKPILCAVGDVGPGEHYFNMGHGVTSAFRSGRLQQVKQFLRESLEGDIVLGNLEGPLSLVSSQRSPVQRAAFRGDPGFAKWLAEAGFNVMHVANNHIMHHGDEACLETLNALCDAGITPLGIAGSDGWCCAPVILPAQGLRVGMLGYCMLPERYVPGQRRYANAGIEQVLEDVARLRAQVDVLWVSLHAGCEGLGGPSPSLLADARRLVDSGVDAVICHHSHVFQPVYWHNEKPIFSSLGNFIFDLFWDVKQCNTAVAKLYQSEVGRLAPALDFVRLRADLRFERLDSSEGAAMQERLIQDERRFASMTQEQHDRLLSSASWKNQLRKLLYFVFNLPRGSSWLKLRFLMEKAVKVM